MSGGIIAYLDACRGITEEQWLGLSPDGERDQADFWTIAQVVPGELRREGDRLARRWIDGEEPETSLECWFRRVVMRLSRHNKPRVEPWVVLYAMGHAYAGREAPSPSEYAVKVSMPVDARTFQRAVSIARDEVPEGREPQNRF